MKRIIYGGLNPSKAGWPDGDLTVTKLCGFTARITGLDLGVIDGGAVFSADGRYRYRLWRDLVAPHVVGDVRVRFDIVNLSAFISTDPDGLNGASGAGAQNVAENMKHIAAALAEADQVIAAWGSVEDYPPWLRYQRDDVLRAFTSAREVHCFGKTKNGSPRHPSRIAYSTPLELFRPRREAVERRDRGAELVKEAIKGGFASIEDFT